MTWCHAETNASHQSPPAMTESGSSIRASRRPRHRLRCSSSEQWEGSPSQAGVPAARCFVHAIAVAERTHPNRVHHGHQRHHVAVSCAALLTLSMSCMRSTSVRRRRTLVCLLYSFELRTGRPAKVDWKNPSVWSELLSPLFRTTRSVIPDGMLVATSKIVRAPPTIRWANGLHIGVIGWVGPPDSGQLACVTAGLRQQAWISRQPLLSPSKDVVDRTGPPSGCDVGAAAQGSYRRFVLDHERNPVEGSSISALAST